jgi:hypothetical protein
MAKDLKNTIKFNDETEEYNINAVKANHVANKLTIKSMGLSGNELANPVEFDGDEPKSISVVPANGGKFIGPIRVPVAQYAQSGGNLKQDGSFVDDAVVNYKDLKDKVLRQVINNSVLYNYANGAIDPAISEGQFNSISVVQGNSSVDDFAKENYAEKYLSAYIFLNTTGDESPETQIYFGTADSETPIPLVTGNSTLAASAGKLATARTIQTNLGAGGAVLFDGTTDVKPGVTGILSMTNGGTGATSAAEASKNLIQNQEIKPDTVVISVPAVASSDALKHWTNGKYGIDLSNSDVVGLNALFFAGTSDTDGECINFVNTINTDNAALTTYDRLYSQKGTLYYDPARKISDDFSATRYEVYHAGGSVIPVNKGGTGVTSLDNLTAGQAKKVKSNYYSSTTASVATKYSNITISPNAPSGGADGDIWIKF